ncbi:uncharacterized protein METZ01_LOCUS513950, partial [marine metagenome]
LVSMSKMRRQETDGEMIRTIRG